MPNFESGVKEYITGYAVVEVSFPVDWRDNPDISCNQCKFFSRSTGRDTGSKRVPQPLRWIALSAHLKGERK